jgi:hypothetical protein
MIRVTPRTAPLSYRHGRAVLLLAMVLLAPSIHAAYPERPVRMIVPQAVGASTDNVARIVATELAHELGQQVVVDNRPGAALQLGMELTAKSPPDGYTIGYAPIGALAIGPNLLSKPLIDPLRMLAPRRTDHHRPHDAAGRAENTVSYGARSPRLCEAESGQAVQRVVQQRLAGPYRF